MTVTVVLSIATFYFKPHMESDNKGLSSNTADGFLLLNAATMNVIVAIGAFTPFVYRNANGRTFMSTFYLLNFFIAVFVCAFQVIRKSQGEKNDSDFEARCSAYFYTCCRRIWCCCRFFSKREANELQCSVELWFFMYAIRIRKTYEASILLGSGSRGFCAWFYFLLIKQGKRTQFLCGTILSF